MQTVSVEQLQDAHRPLRRRTLRQVRSNMRRLGYDWRNGLPVNQIERYAKKYVYERHQDDFVAALPSVEDEKPKPKRKPRKKAETAE